jgi:acyl-CoA thioesterase
MDDSGSPTQQSPAARMLAADVASNALGIELVELGEDMATVRMTMREDMINGHAIGHGGYVFLLADTAFACACTTRGPVTVAAGADINFLAPVHVGDTLVARAAIRVSHGRSGIYDVTVTRDESVVAEFRGRSRTLKAGAGPATGRADIQAEEKRRG